MRFIESIQRRCCPIRESGMTGQPLPPAMLTQLLRQVGQTQEREIACDEAYRFMDWLADVVARGEVAGGLMPQVQQHFARCQDCREEFDALLRALDATKA
jgi:hypothetical protein